MMKLLEKKVIRGCEARGDHDSAYLTRFTILGTRWQQVCLHIFHRSDGDDMHDHPWPFLSIILWRGYIEVTPQGRKRVWPGSILFRCPHHVHRVELVNGKRAVTLVFMGKRVREWGFFTKRGWQQWQAYFKQKGC